jgi:lipid-binding SYLF domain-containing protein
MPFRKGPRILGAAPVRRITVDMLEVKVHYSQGLASQAGSESCGVWSNPQAEALTGESIGRVLSHESPETGVPRNWAYAEGNTALDENASSAQTPRGRRPRACADAYRAGTERADCHPSGMMALAGRIGKSKMNADDER